MINQIYWVIKFLRLLKKNFDSTVISKFFKLLKSDNFNLHFIKNKASEKKNRGFRRFSAIWRPRLK